MTTRQNTWMAAAILLAVSTVQAGTQVLFDTGPERLVMVDSGGLCNYTTTYLGWSSGRICNPDCPGDTQPQRRAAQPFTLADGASWHITEIWVDGFLPDPISEPVEELRFQIFSRSQLNVAPTQADSVATGSVALPTPQQHPDGGTANSLFVMNVDLTLSPGDYWLSVWGESSNLVLPSRWAWFTNAENGINNVDPDAYMWCSSMYPVPGFVFHQLDVCILTVVPGDDPDDLYNASFRILGSGSVSCPWDCGGDNNGDVGIVDFLALLAQWGGAGTCDFDGGGVGIVDFLALLANWGPCP